jgi:hypothetical protein
MRRSELFVRFANACTDKDYENLEKSHGWDRSLMDTVTDFDIDAVSCEQLYRVASLLAYGHTYEKKAQTIGLATWKDIERFSILLPDEKESRLIVELPSRVTDKNVTADKSGVRLNVPDAIRTHANVVMHSFSDYQTFTLIKHNEDGLTDSRVMAALLGQAIANHFAIRSFRGWHNGQPQIEPDNAIGESWVTLASLPDKQAPGLCQCCGKVIDRRVGGKGGRPALTCGEDKNPTCSTLFNNEQRRLRIADDPESIHIDSLEQKAREIRWRDGNDGRPLQCFGLHPLIPDIHLPFGSRE